MQNQDKVTGPGDRIAPFTLLPFRGGTPIRWQPGSVTVLSFCALWCDTWRTQSRRLIETQQALSGLPIQFHTISVDGRWAEKYESGNTSGTVLLDLNGRLSSDLGVRAVPYTLVLDRAGMVQFASQGIVRSEELQAVVRDVCVRSGGQKRGTVYLTFDDFPTLPDDLKSRLSPDELLLDILRASEVPATFFCIGAHLEAPVGKAVALRAVREGHQLQIHSWDHNARDPQIARCVRVMQEISPDRAPTLYRPPGSSVLREINGREITLARLTVNPYDFARPGEPELMRRVLQSVKPGAVIQLHAGIAEVRSVLPSLLRSLLQRGYGFETLR